MKRYNIEPRSYGEHVLINHYRNLGEDDETIAERLKAYRLVYSITNIIAGVSLVGILCLFGFSLYQLLFVG